MSERHQLERRLAEKLRNADEVSEATQGRIYTDVKERGELFCSCCGKKGEVSDSDLPKGWLSLREGLGGDETVEDYYCSHDCLRTVENDD